MKIVKTNIPIILFSILPISIIIGSSASLLNNILFSLCFVFIYFSRKSIKIFDFKPVLLLIVLSLYLIINSLNSIDMSSGIYRNFGFIRFILFFIMVNYLFFIDEKNFNIFKIWTIICFIVLIDIGKVEINGVLQPHGDRVISFFRNEPIAGAFFNGLLFIILGYVLNFLKSKNIQKVFGFLIIFLCLVGVMLTGERSNGLKAFIGLLIFISMIDYVKLKSKILILLSIFVIFFLTINLSDYVKFRYINQFYDRINT